MSFNAISRSVKLSLNSRSSSASSPEIDESAQRVNHAFADSLDKS